MGRNKKFSGKCHNFQLVETRLPDGRIVTAFRDINLKKDAASSYTVAGVEFDKTGLYIPKVQKHVRYDGDSAPEDEYESSYAWDPYADEEKQDEIECEEYYDTSIDVNVPTAEKGGFTIKYVNANENENDDEEEDPEILAYMKACVEEESHKMGADGVESIELLQEQKNATSSDGKGENKNEFSNNIEPAGCDTKRQQTEKKKRRKIQCEELGDEVEKEYFEKELDQVLNMDIDDKTLKEGKDIIINNGKVINTIQKGTTIIEGGECKLVLAAKNVQNPNEYEKTQAINNEQESQRVVDLTQAVMSKDDEKAMYTVGDAPKDTVRVIKVSKKTQNSLLAFLGFEDAIAEEEEEEEEEEEGHDDEKKEKKEEIKKGKEINQKDLSNEKKQHKESVFDTACDGAAADEMNGVMAFWDNNDGDEDVDFDFGGKKPTTHKKDEAVVRKLSQMSDEKLAELAELAEMFGCDDVNMLSMEQLNTLLDLTGKITEQDQKIMNATKKANTRMASAEASGRLRRLISKNGGGISAERLAQIRQRRTGKIDYTLDAMKEKNLLGPQVSAEATLELLKEMEENERELKKKGELTRVEKMLKEWTKPIEVKTILEDQSELFSEQKDIDDTNAEQRNTKSTIKAAIIDGKSGIKISTKTGLPLDASNKTRFDKSDTKNEEAGDNNSDEAEGDADGVYLPELPSYRPKNETEEEKKFRKTMTKEAKRERRAAKKELTVSFKVELGKQNEARIAQRMNVQGRKLF